MAGLRAADARVTARASGPTDFTAAANAASVIAVRIRSHLEASGLASLALFGRSLRPGLAFALGIDLLLKLDLDSPAALSLRARALDFRLSMGALRFGPGALGFGPAGLLGKAGFLGCVLVLPPPHQVCVGRPARKLASRRGLASRRWRCCGASRISDDNV